MDGKRSLGARVRELRERRGLSQDELAERVSVDRTHIIAIEKGRRRPSLDVLQTMAPVLGSSLEELLVAAGYALQEAPVTKERSPEEVLAEAAAVIRRERMRQRGNDSPATLLAEGGLEGLTDEQIDELQRRIQEEVEKRKRPRPRV